MSSQIGNMSGIVMSGPKDGTQVMNYDIENMQQLLEKGSRGLDQSSSMKVKSMYMGKSSINYDEINNRFEEHFEVIPENIILENSYFEQNMQILGTIAQS
jgi:hypothetical protein